jgi:hypothetical protein
MQTRKLNKIIRPKLVSESKKYGRPDTYTQKAVTLILITAVVFLIPLLMWGNLYSVGGDDTRLYYLFPELMLERFAFNIVSNNTLGTAGGYLSTAFFAPFLTIITVLKRLVYPVNVQMFMYGLNMAGGFLFFYLVTGLFIRDRSRRWAAPRIIASLAYVFSFYLTRTLYQHQLLAIYVVGYVPAVMYFLLRGILGKDIWMTLAAAFIYSAFSGAILTWPWFGAVIVSLFPLIIVLILKYPRMVLLHSAVFVGTTLLLNLSWLAHQLYPILKGSQTSNILRTVTSGELRQANIDLIRALSHLNGPVNQFAAYLRSSWADRINMQASQSFGIVMALVIIAAGIFYRRTDRKVKGLYLLSVSMLLWTMSLVTPNFGDWNISLFIFLNNTVPFFAMFRNMYDKFAYPMAFTYAFALAISLYIVSNSLKRRAVTAALYILVLSVTVFNARSFIFPRYEKSDFNMRVSGTFDPQFLELSEFVRNMDEPSRFLWLPLNFPSYVAIEDAENPGHYYFGSSPLQFFAGVSDFTGFQSFANAFEPRMNFRLMTMIREKKYADAAQIFRRMNAKYVIIDHRTIPGYGGRHMNFEGIVDAQTDEFYAELIGRKIRDFGTVYSLYEINPRYKNDKIFLTSDVGEYVSDVQTVQFTKLSETEYSVFLEAHNEAKTLAFLEPYNNLWELFAFDRPSGAYRMLDDVGHRVMYDFANGYTLTPDHFSAGQPAEFRLRFRPAEVSGPANAVTAASWVLISVLLTGRLVLVSVRGIKEKVK